jgi:hypothetical protein
MMARARASIIRACGIPPRHFFRIIGGIATVSGVGFFDFRHGQRGVAPNAIEVHPVLGFRAVSCAEAQPPVSEVYNSALSTSITDWRSSGGFCSGAHLGGSCDPAP